MQTMRQCARHPLNLADRKRARLLDNGKSQWQQLVTSTECELGALSRKVHLQGVLVNLNGLLGHSGSSTGHVHKQCELGVENIATKVAVIYLSLTFTMHTFCTLLVINEVLPSSKRLGKHAAHLDMNWKLPTDFVLADLPSLKKPSRSQEEAQVIPPESAASAGQARS